MIAKLVVYEGEVRPSDQPQTVKAVLGSSEIPLTITSATETSIDGERLIQGQVTGLRGEGWQFLLFPEVHAGVVYNNNATFQEASKQALGYKSEADTQAIAARCC